MSFFKRRTLLNKISVLLFAALIPCVLWAARPRIAIYFPSLSSAQVLQKEFQKQLPDFQVSVFAKYRDYDEYIKIYSPEYLVGYVESAKLSSYVNLNETEGKKRPENNFVLVGLEPNISLKKKLRLGLVEFTDRESLKKSMEEAFGVSFSAIRTVAKPIDLFPLLVFQSVDLIVVEENIYKELTSRYSTKTHIIGSPKKAEAPSVFVKKVADEEFKKPELKKAVLKLLGVDVLRGANEK